MPLVLRQSSRMKKVIRSLWDPAHHLRATDFCFVSSLFRAPFSEQAVQTRPRPPAFAGSPRWHLMRCPSDSSFFCSMSSSFTSYIEDFFFYKFSLEDFLTCAVLRVFTIRILLICLKNFFIAQGKKIKQSSDCFTKVLFLQLLSRMNPDLLLCHGSKNELPSSPFL